MKLLPWIIAAAGISAAAYVIANAPSTQPAAANGDVANAANSAGLWGTKQRLSGIGGEFSGKLKEDVGQLTGDRELQGEGLIDQAGGAINDTAGQAAHAVSDSLHDLNQG